LTVRLSHLTPATITHRGYRIPEAARKKDVMTDCFNRQDRTAIVVVLVVVLDFTIRGRGRALAAVEVIGKPAARQRLSAFCFLLSAFCFLLSAFCFLLSAFNYPVIIGCLSNSISPLPLCSRYRRKPGEKTGDRQK
jgi:hypothetical protein